MKIYAKGAIYSFEGEVLIKIRFEDGGFCFLNVGKSKEKFPLNHRIEFEGDIAFYFNLFPVINSYTKLVVLDPDNNVI